MRSDPSYINLGPQQHKKKKKPRGHGSLAKQGQKEPDADSRVKF